MEANVKVNVGMRGGFSLPRMRISFLHMPVCVCDVSGRPVCEANLDPPDLSVRVSLSAW